MKLEPFYEKMLPAIESSLQHAVAGSFRPKLEEMHRMLEYHMGWEGEGAGPEARGKRIRPLLVLLCAASAGGDWEKALPGAAAVELIHNFSLVHDDIQDQSPTRRGRTTLWTRWGVAQAINAGDALFSLAQTTLMELADTVSLPAALSASRDLNETCLSLTQGQFLDLAYEDRQDLSIDDYWPMVAGKTAALISSCTYIGSLAAQAEPKTCQVYRKFGELLGLAFQVQDDLLGIWGDAQRLGKSTLSDLVSGKKSLPVLYGLGLNGDFARRWKQRNIKEDEVPGLALQLEAEGGRLFGEQQADRLTKEALAALTSADPQGEAGQALCELSEYLLKRKT